MKYEPRVGSTINTEADEMVALAILANDRVEIDFNGIQLVAIPGKTTPQEIVNTYRAESERRAEGAQKKREAWARSPEGIAEQKRRDEERRKFVERRDAALGAAPAEMTLRNAAAWREWIAANQDGYGGAVVQFAERWARIMEGMIASGQHLKDCADDACSLADDGIGITGFMYGCAVGMLAEVWVHGEELRRWHNLKTQIRNEGEKANESGGVLNPALLRIGG